MNCFHCEGYRSPLFDPMQGQRKIEFSAESPANGNVRVALGLPEMRTISSCGAPHFQSNLPEFFCMPDHCSLIYDLNRFAAATLAWLDLPVVVATIEGYVRRKK